MRRAEIEFSKALPSRSAAGKRSAGDWGYLGPDKLGGRTRALALDVSDPTGATILAGGVSSGVWRSVDRGQSWTSTFTSDQLKSVTSLAQDTRSGQTATWYAGTGEWSGNSAGDPGAPFRGDGVYKSLDSGQSWSLLSATSTGNPGTYDRDFDYVWRVATVGSNLSEDELYVVTSTAIFRSTDGGGSFQKKFSLSSDGDVTVYESGRVVVAADSRSGTGLDFGVHYSFDGDNWTDITPSPWDRDLWFRPVLAVDPSNDDLLYVTVEAYNDQGQEASVLFQYRFSTGVWVDLTPNVPEGLNSQFGYDLHVAVDPTDANTLYLGGTNLYRSASGFSNSASTKQIGGYAYSDRSWSGDHHPDQHLLIFDPDVPGRAYSASDGGVHVTDDIRAATVEWTSLNNGYQSGQFYTIAQDEMTPASEVVSGGTQDNGTWTRLADSDLDWTETWGGDGSHTVIRQEGRLRYVSSQRGSIYRVDYTDTGGLLDWTYLTPGGYSYWFIHPFEVDRNDDNVVFLPTFEVLVRHPDVSSAPIVDGALQGWEALPDYPRGDSDGNEYLFALAQPWNEGTDKLFVGTDEGGVFVYEGISDPGSATVRDITGNLDDGERRGFISDIAVAVDDANELLVVFSNYGVRSVWHSTDEGATWMDVSGNLEEFPSGLGNGPSIRAAEIVGTGAGREYYLGTSTGVYSTAELDGGNTSWTREAESVIGNTVVDALSYRPSDGKLLAATHGRGVFGATVGTGSANTPIAVVSASTFSPGSSVTLQVDVGSAGSPVSDLFGVSFALSFDSSLLTYVGAESGSFVGSGVLFSAFPSASSVGVGLSKTAGNPGVSGFGTVAQLEFTLSETALDGQALAFNLSEISATDSDQTEINLTATNLEVSVDAGLPVWAGDANNDNSVNQADILPLGAHFSRTGAARDQSGCAWLENRVTPWDVEAATYADTNGDGLVNQADILCIGANFGRSRGSTVVASKESSSGPAGTVAVRKREESPLGDEYEIVVDGIEDEFLGVSFIVTTRDSTVEFSDVSPGDLMGPDGGLLFWTVRNGNLHVGASPTRPASLPNGSVVRFRVGGESRDPSLALLEPTRMTSAGNLVGMRSSSMPGEEVELPTDVAILSAFPNPFQSTARIEFNIESETPVELTVYDLLGRRVAKLVDEVLPSGRHQSVLNGSGLASGVYIYNLTTPSGSVSGNLTLKK